MQSPAVEAVNTQKEAGGHADKAPAGSSGPQRVETSRVKVRASVTTSLTPVTGPSRARCPRPLPQSSLSAWRSPHRGRQARGYFLLKVLTRESVRGICHFFGILFLSSISSLTSSLFPSPPKCIYTTPQRWRAPSAHSPCPLGSVRLRSVSPGSGLRFLLARPGDRCGVAALGFTVFSAGG